ncbi:protein of unknown function [Eubacterium ruminantium]|uniref:DUF3784 domain-containing protein n=1 Tax=Eubacterium ruminantium TaxID=42322 RepID=A0A1T4MH33_9FIRM|nr:DUF3784 domain-containing protein [Eubacterium ruminantium]SCW48006.1 protein of unknown function [Eubacterium ruminantium]SDM56474.1 protein of unknown function [Eubacterium ruminantium]SJZ66223.1 protein of unknown function [Eubacterium ruminantium]
MIAVEIIMYVAAALCITLGILQVKEKGPLINNAWIYANKEERRTMDKKPYYRQSGIVFLLIGIQLIMDGLFCGTKNYIFLIVEYVLLVLVVVYAVVSAIRIDKKKKNNIK